MLSTLTIEFGDRMIACSFYWWIKAVIVDLFLSCFMGFHIVKGSMINHWQVNMTISQMRTIDSCLSSFRRETQVKDLCYSIDKLVWLSQMRIMLSCLSTFRKQTLVTWEVPRSVFTFLKKNMAPFGDLVSWSLLLNFVLMVTATTFITIPGNYGVFIHVALVPNTLYVLLPWLIIILIMFTLCQWFSNFNKHLIHLDSY